MFGFSTDFLFAMGIVLGALGLIVVIDLIKGAAEKPRVHPAE
jgi:hypothetical protein